VSHDNRGGGEEKKDMDSQDRINLLLKGKR